MFTLINEAVVWNHISKNRQELANFLETLTMDEWNHISLCDGWRVRDVVAHLLIIYSFSLRQDFKEFALNGFRSNTYIRRSAVRYGNNNTYELLQEFKSKVSNKQKPGSLPALNALVDLLVHEQDIRIPLGRSRNMPLDSLKIIFSHWQPTDFNIGERISGVSKNVKNKQFVITDLDITVGSGAIVKGKAQDILMEMVGRKKLT